MAIQKVHGDVDNKISPLGSGRPLATLKMLEHNIMHKYKCVAI